MRTAPEQRAHGLGKTAVFFPKRQKKSARKTIDGAGKRKRRKIPVAAEKADKLGSRQKTRANRRSDQKKRRTHHSHIPFTLRTAQKKYAF